MFCLSAELLHEGNQSVKKVSDKKERKEFRSINSQVEKVLQKTVTTSPSDVKGVWSPEESEVLGFCKGSLGRRQS